MIEEQKGITEAESLLEDLGFDSLPIKPAEVANAIDSQDFRLVMESHAFQSDKILGKAEGNSKAALIYLNTRIPDPGRYNFTAAHELGHVCLHIIPEKIFTFECGTKELNDFYDNPAEKEANGFASGLLLPKSLLPRWELNWKSVSDISKLCGTSLEATYRRLSYLERAPSAMIIHKGGNFKRFVATGNFGFYINNYPLSTDQKSLVTDVKSDPYPSDFDEVDASDWVNPQYKGLTLEIIHVSTILLKDGFTYSLLTYDDECLQDDETDSY